jgi:hypothetical protein
MKDVAIEFTSEDEMYNVLSRMSIKFIQSDSECTICEASVTDVQEKELLALNCVVYLSEL